MDNDNKTEFVTAGGHRLRVRWFAPRKTPDQAVIVLLHQGLGSVTQWRNFPEVLADKTGCAVVGYDRWGHGQSDPLVLPRSPKFVEYEARSALRDVLDVLGIERPVLYGHSDGGSIVLEFAASFPDRPLATISEAAHVFSEVDSTDGFSAVVEDFEKGGLRPKLERHHGSNVDAMFYAWADVWRSPDMKGWRMTDRLPEIRCPVLVVQGRDDEHGSQAQIDAIGKSVSGPVETCILPGCAHSPHLEATDAVAEASAAFLRRAGIL